MKLSHAHKPVMAAAFALAALAGCAEPESLATTPDLTGVALPAAFTQYGVDYVIDMPAGTNQTTVRRVGTPFQDHPFQMEEAGQAALVFCRLAGGQTDDFAPTRGTFQPQGAVWSFPALCQLGGRA